MAYIPNIVGSDEKLIGIARLHWIYVVTGVAWFLGFLFAGNIASDLITQFAVRMSEAIKTTELPMAMIAVGDRITMFMAGIGALMCLFYVVKYLVTEIGLTNRRVIHKKGWLFVKVHQIDLEEIRGESLDLGGLGRFLNYAFLKLDCRFIGDIRLPAIAHAENFIKALHKIRAEAQDVLSVAVGKNNPARLEIVGESPAAVEAQEPQKPHVPEPIAPTQPLPPEVPAQPVVPNSPPPQAEAKPAVDPEAVAQAMREVMPEVAQQVVKEMAEQGLIPKAEAAQLAQPEQSDEEIAEEMASAFDEASHKKLKAGSVFRHGYTVN